MLTRKSHLHTDLFCPFPFCLKDRQSCMLLAVAVFIFKKELVLGFELLDYRLILYLTPTKFMIKVIYFFKFYFHFRPILSSPQGLLLFSGDHLWCQGLNLNQLHASKHLTHNTISLIHKLIYLQKTI